MTERVVFEVDPDDPRAPADEVWAQLDEAERARVIDALPSEIERTSPPEGDPHRRAKESALDALGHFFERIGRKVYLSAELPVYYSNERVFAPDVIAVLDVEPHDRMRWVVAAEGKGLDFAMEVHVRGDHAKDHERNVVPFARLGIPEYFLFDWRRQMLRGFRLRGPEARVYEPIVPQHGRVASRVLGLDLALEGEALRFYSGTAPLAESDELIARLGAMVDGLVKRGEEADVARAEVEAALEQERARADDAERRLAEALAELARLRERR